MADRLNFDFGKTNGKKSFKDIDDFYSWLQKEKSNYNWVGHESVRTPNTTNVWQVINKRFTPVASLAEQVIANKSTDQYEQLLNKLQKMILDVYGNDNLLISENSKIKFVNEVYENDKAFAAEILAFYLLDNYQVINRTSLKAAYETLQFEQGNKDNVKHEREALTDLKNEWNDERISQADAFQQNVLDAVQLKEDAEKLISDQKEAHDELIKNTNKQLSDLENTYNQKLALKAPITYWKRRARIHADSARDSGLAAFFVAVVLGWCVVYFGYDLIVTLEGTQPKLWQLTSLGIAIGLVVWVIRIFVRVYLSNYHMMMDTRERVTMLNTYLALLKEGEGLKESDRNIILQIVFRPTHFGLIKDEGTPPGMLDLLSKLVSKD